ncbi:hypothetical protein MJG53_000194 [Ovis ammon polii x Ovis aries]|nr:hypothetical protein MJG53_000194 [Ovis ammon polii x Ovis aries]
MRDPFAACSGENPGRSRRIARGGALHRKEEARGARPHSEKPCFRLVARDEESFPGLVGKEFLAFPSLLKRSPSPQERREELQRRATIPRVPQNSQSIPEEPVFPALPRLSHREEARGARPHSEKPCFRLVARDEESFPGLVGKEFLAFPSLLKRSPSPQERREELQCRATIPRVPQNSQSIPEEPVFPALPRLSHRGLTPRHPRERKPKRSPSNSHGDWPFLRPPERVPEVPTLSRQHLPQLEKIQEILPFRSFTPLLELKTFPDIPVSTLEEARGSRTHPEEPRFRLLARDEGSFPVWSGKNSRRSRRISRGGALHRKGLRPRQRRERNPERPTRNSHGDWPFLRPPERVPGGPFGKNYRRSRRISRGGALHRKDERTPESYHHSKSPTDVSVHSKGTCFPCTASTFMTRIDSHDGGSWDSPVGKPRRKASKERERIPSVPVASQEEALSTGKARGTPGSCHHFKSAPDVSVHSRGTCFTCTALTFKPRIDSHHVCTRDSPVGKPRGKASKESHRTLDQRDGLRDPAATALEESASACPHSRRGLTPLGRLQKYPKIHVSTGEESSGSGPDSTQGLSHRHRQERNPERPPRKSHGDWPFLRPPERVPEVPVVSLEHLLQLEKIQEVLPSRRGNEFPAFPSHLKRRRSPQERREELQGRATIPRVPQMCQSIPKKRIFPALPRRSYRGSTPTTVARGTALWESLVGKPRGKDAGENHRSFDPRGGLGDTAATALEESASACPHSRRGLTPLWRLQKYPKIHVSTGEESSGSGPDSTQGLRPRHRRARNPERPPRNSHGDWSFLRTLERVPEVPVGKNSRRSRRISRGGTLHRKGQRNSRVVPPFQESPRCVSPFQRNLFSLHCLDVHAEDRLPPRFHVDSTLGKPRGKASRENHRSLDPGSRMGDTAAIALEESTSACPHSSRGLTPLGSLQMYPKIHVSTGEESSGSGPDSTQGLRPRHRRERNPERPPRNSHGDWPFLRGPERVPEVPVGKNSRRSRRISRGGALHRKGERSSRVVPPFQESPRCVSAFQRNLFSLHCLDVQAEDRLPQCVHVGQPYGKDSWERLVGKTRGKTIDPLIHAADCETLLLPLWRKAQVHSRIRDED